MKKVCPVFLGCGLGNLMFRTAAAYAHALKHNYECCLLPPAYKSHKLLHAILKDKLPIIKSVSDVYEHKTLGFASIPAGVTGCIDGLFESIHYFIDHQAAVKNLYENVIQSTQEGTLGVHIRLGDFITANAQLGKQLFHITTAPLLTKMLDLTQNTTLFLFSNDLKQAFNITNEAVRKLGKPIRIIPVNADTLTTLSLMTAMEEFVMSASTFSWWGAFLSNATTVIAPKPWHPCMPWLDEHYHLQQWITVSP